MVGDSFVVLMVVIQLFGGPLAEQEPARTRKLTGTHTAPIRRDHHRGNRFRTAARRSAIDGRIAAPLRCAE
jgi:hypothetical protein